MSDGPRRLLLETHLACPDLRAATAAAVGACGASLSMPSLLGWYTGEDGPLQTHDLPPPTLDAVSLAFVADPYDALIRPDDAPGRFVLTFTWRGTAGAETALDAWRAVLGALAAQGVLRHAEARRHLGGNCLPVLPLVGDSTHLLACPAEAIAQAYQDAALFAAAWDRMDRVDDMAIFTRALEHTGNPDFLAHVLPGHMAMARLARGGVTFRTPQFEPGEFELLDAGEPTLTGVGYHGDAAIYEFAGHTPPGTELRCIDLLNAARLVSAGRLPDGRPVREVRAVFMDREQAQRSGGLLQAAGVAVYWEDETATLRAL